MKNRSIRSIFFLVFFLSVLWFAPSRTGATGTHFDLSFDDNGKLSTDFGGEDGAKDVAIQADGKIVVVGTNGASGDFAIARYNTNGSLDPSFDGDGKATIDLDFGVANAVAIQPDGKIVVVGTALGSAIQQLGFTVARFNSNGSLDTTFATVGYLIFHFNILQGASASAKDIALQPDGHIVVVGRSTVPGLQSWVALRFNSNGTRDSAFGFAGASSGQGANAAESVVVLSDGKILVGGVRTDTNADFALELHNPNGTLDTGFGGGDGLVTTDFSGADDSVNDVKILSDGRILAAGSATVSSRKRFALARYNADGSTDTTFNLIGRITTDVSIFTGGFIEQIALQADGKIVAVGENNSSGLGEGDFCVVRYNPNGSLDAAFGRGGILRSDLNNNSDDNARAVALQADGRIVVAGDIRSSIAGSQTSFGVARYLPNINTKFDFDGDSKADESVVRGPNFNTWYFLGSTSGFTSTTFGLPTDRLGAADYDGDGIADVAVFRPSNGTWYLVRSASNTFISQPFGVAEDLPTPADYDGDGKADISVFRPSVGSWYRLNSGNGAFVATQFGANGDKPTIGDFDGDGRADLAVFRPSTTTWYRYNSTGGAFVQVQFGIASDFPTPGDFDGDGKTDVSVFRPADGVWYRLNSSNGAFVSTQFGTAGDIPVVSDYDRDGRDDVAVFRTSTGSGVWYRLNSSNGAFVSIHFGSNGDRPTPAAFQY
ncbi:MAG: FG-GAP-like repeat-containing protein [Pyrinomonadaceae bacterium]